MERCLIFRDFEWKAACLVLYKKVPPRTSRTIEEMVKIIASFGGFLNRKCDGYPGIKAIWEGMKKLSPIVLAYTIINNILLETYG